MSLTKAHNRMIEGSTVNVKDFGAVGDGVTDDTAAIQACSDYCSSNGGFMYLPEGTFLTTGITILDGTKLHGIKGAGVGITILKAASGAGSLIHYTGEHTKTYRPVISNFTIDGNDETNVVGLKLGTEKTILMHTVKDMKITKCAVGIEMPTVMETVVRDSEISRCVIAIKAYQDPVKGGLNANLFASLAIQYNEIGIFINATTSVWPSASIYINQCTIQGNTHCAIYANSVNMLSIFQTYTEANCSGGGAPSMVIDGVSVDNVLLHTVGCTTSVDDFKTSEGFGPIARLESSSFLSIRNTFALSPGYVFVDADDTSFVSMANTIGSQGVFNNVLNYPTIISDIALGSIGMSGVPTFSKTDGFENEYTHNNGMQITMQNKNNANYYTEYDPLFGEVNGFEVIAGGTSGYVTFLASGSLVAGEVYYNSMLIKADADLTAELSWRNGVQTVDLKANKWTRVVFIAEAALAVATRNVTFRLYTSSANKIVATALVSLNVTDKLESIGEILSKGQFASSIKTLSGTSAPTSGTWKVGDKVYNTSPSASGTMGWVCTTAGTPGTWKTFGAISA